MVIGGKVQPVISKLVISIEVVISEVVKTNSTTSAITFVDSEQLKAFNLFN